MAQSQAQAKEASSANTRRTANVPATQNRGGPLTSRDPMAWSVSPFGLMRRLSDDMDQLFGQLAGGLGTTGRGGLTPAVLAPAVDWMPALETFERDGNLIVQADLPGLGADDVTIEVADGVLTFSGERREERETDDGGIRRTERRYGRFTRSIALPEDARTDDIQAAFRDGVLEITVPLSQSGQQRRTVPIQNTRSGAGRNAGAGASGEAAAS
jgi:HSP20 family protein